MAKEELEFYDVKAKKKFKTTKYDIRVKKKRKFAVATSPLTGIKAHRLVKS